MVIPRGAAHRGGDVAVFHVGSTRPQETIELGHELKGAQFDILVIWRKAQEWSLTSNLILLILSNADYDF